MSNRIAPSTEPRRRVRVRRCSFRFAGRPECVKQARDWLAERLALAGAAEDTASTALLLLSEIATNTVVHTPSETKDFCVRAFFAPTWLRVEVRNVDGLSPVVRPVAAAPDAEGGRGLFLVDSLASRWGCFRSPRGPGVYFEMRWDV